MRKTAMSHVGVSCAMIPCSIWRVPNPQPWKILRKFGRQRQTGWGKIGKEIIRAVNLGLATPKDQIVVTKRRPALTDEETAKLSLLKMLLSVKAAEAGTAARMLASSQDLEELARTPLDLWQEKDIPCLSGWRKGLYGDSAQALVQGQLWIGFENGSVQVRDSSQ